MTRQPPDAPQCDNLPHPKRQVSSTPDHTNSFTNSPSLLAPLLYHEHSSFFRFYLSIMESEWHAVDVIHAIDRIAHGSGTLVCPVQLIWN